MTTGKQASILGASSNLLGICFVIITGLKISKVAESTFADEISLGAAFGFMGGCAFSYMSMRSQKYAQRYENAADYLFLTGLGLLSLALVVLAETIIV